MVEKSYRLVLPNQSNHDYSLAIKHVRGWLQQRDEQNHLNGHMIPHLVEEDILILEEALLLFV